MKAEDILSGPISTSFKFAVYVVFGVISVALALFIVWSVSCLGSLCVQLIGQLF